MKCLTYSLTALALTAMFVSYSYAQQIEHYSNEQGKIGFRDHLGNTLIEPKYDYVWPFDEYGLAMVNIGGETSHYGEVYGGTWGAVDTNGQEIIETKYQYYLWFHDGIAAACVDNKWGFVDQSGKILVPLQYDFSKYLSEGFGLVNIGLKSEGFITEVVLEYGLYGVVNRSNRLILPIEFSNISLIHGYFFASKELNGESKFGVYSTNGDVIFPAEYSTWEWNGLANDVCILGSPGHLGLMDSNLHSILAMEYEYMMFYSVDRNYVLAAKKTNSNGTRSDSTKWGVYNTERGWVVQPKYDQLIERYDTYLDVRSGEKWGVLDPTSGLLKVPTEFIFCANFNEGLAAFNEGGVRQEDGSVSGGLWGYINESGEIVIPAQFNSAGDFFNGKATVKTGSKEYFINSLGVKTK